MRLVEAVVAAAVVVVVGVAVVELVVVVVGAQILVELKMAFAVSPGELIVIERIRIKLGNFDYLECKVKYLLV